MLLFIGYLLRFWGVLLKVHHQIIFWRFVKIEENNNSVLIHFGGFEDLLEAKTFSHHIMNELGIERLFVPRGVTIH